jgi:hypothetical protein
MPTGLILGVFIFELVISVVFFGAILALWKYWKSEEVQVRGKTTTILGICGPLALAVLTLTVNWYEWDYVTYPSMYTVYTYEFPVLLSSMAGSMVIRTIVIAFKFKITKEQSLALEQKNDSSIQNSNWFSRHRYLIQERYQAMALLTWSIVCFIPIMNIRESVVIGTNILVLSTMVFVFTVGFYSSRSCVDFWGIKRELQIAVGTSLIAIVCYFISFLVLGNAAAGDVVQSVIVAFERNLINVLAYYPMVLKPLLRARKIAKSKNSTFAGVESSNTITEADAPGISSENQAYLDAEFFKKSRFFASLLKDQKFKEAFAAHLLTEFSCENLVFVGKVCALYETIRKSKRLESMDGMEEAIEELRQINETFVMESSPLWVNLSSKVLDPLQVELQNIESDYALLSPGSSEADIRKLWISIATVYQRAAYEATEMMEQDSFRRFKLTSAYKTFQNQKIAVMVMTKNNPDEKSGLI